MVLVPEALAEALGNKAGLDLETVAVINGLNYTKGKWMNLVLLSPN